MFAIAGVSGRCGAATADALLKQGQKVRVLVRKPEQGEPWVQRRCEVAVADFNDEASLKKALTGVSGAFLMLPPLPQAADPLAEGAKLIDHMAHAVKAAGLKTLVYLSSVGAQHPTGTGPVVAHHRAEKVFKGLAPSVTFVRPAFFLENWAQQFMSVLETGELRHFGPTNVKFPQVGTHDVGVAAANALVAAAPGTHAIELAGRENWSVDDVVAVVHSLLDTPVKAVALPPESAKGAYLAMGMPEAQATLMAELAHAMNHGLLAFAHPHGFQRGTQTLYDTLKPLV